MLVNFDPRGAALLSEKSFALAQAGAELGAFGDVDPGLAAECGVEIASLEARTILASGVVARVATLSGNAARSGRPLNLEHGDIEVISRLEAVVALGNSRIGLKIAAMDAEESQGPAATIGNLMGLATGAVGLYKAIF